MKKHLLVLLKVDRVMKLVDIVKTSSEYLNKFLEDKSQIIVESQRHESHTSFYIILSDCPFIVSTIAESVRNIDYRMASLLHPLLTYEGYRVSLSYLEIDAISSEHASVFSRRLKKALNNLISVTSDFYFNAC